MEIKASTLKQFKRELKEVIVSQVVMYHHISIDEDATIYTAEVRDREMYITIPGKRIYGTQIMDLKRQSIQRIQYTINTFILKRRRIKDKMISTSLFLFLVASPYPELNSQLG